jgi:drug/metabolite transporter (DMT)-like permease
MWGGYPLVIRSVGLGGPQGALLLTLTALVPIAIATTTYGGWSRLSGSEWLRMSVAGGMMGIGLLAFSFVASSKRIDASISIPIVDTAMLLVSVVAAVWFFAEPVTVRKLIGVALLIAGILVLRPQ